MGEDPNRARQDEDAAGERGRKSELAVESPQSSCSGTPMSEGSVAFITEAPWFTTI